MYIIPFRNLMQTIFMYESLSKWQRARATVIAGERAYSRVRK